MTFGCTVDTAPVSGTQPTVSHATAFPQRSRARQHGVRNSDAESRLEKAEIDGFSG